MLMLISKSHLQRIMHYCPLDTALVNTPSTLMHWKTEAALGKQLATNHPRI